MIKLVRGRVGRLLRSHHLLLRAGKLRLQGVRHRLGNVTLHRKNIAQLAIVDLRPEMRIGHRVNELDVDAHLVARFLHASFQNIRDAELPCDLGQIGRRALESLCRCPRNHLQVRDLGKRVRISSCTPSAKKALSGSRLRLSNGKTAIDFADNSLPVVSAVLFPAVYRPRKNSAIELRRR